MLGCLFGVVSQGSLVSLTKICGIKKTVPSVGPSEVVLPVRTAWQPSELLPDVGPPGWRFSGAGAQGGSMASEQFCSVIGTLLPIALWGRTSLWS
jgi:hypothetical protein